MKTSSSISFLMVAIIAAASLTVSRAEAATLSLPGFIHFQGQIVDNNGAPLEASNVTFTLQVTSVSGTCTVYAETQSYNMTNSNGIFDLALGAGTPLTGFSSANFVKSFSNTTPFPGLDCGTYSPSSSEARKLKVTFNDGSQTVALSSPYLLSSVPYALYADSIQGKQAADLIQVNSTSAALTQANIESIFDTIANVTQLQNLIAGTSTKYAKFSSATSDAIPVYTGAPSAPVKGSIWYDSTANKLTYYDGTNPQQLGTSGGTVTSITAGSGLSGGTITATGTISMPSVGAAGTYSKVTTDAQGRVSSGSALAASDIPNLDASQITTGVLATAQVPSDATKLSLSGGTMTGAIAMGGKNITATGYITMSNGTYLGVGVYDDTAEGTLVSGTLTSGGASYKGVTWYNSTSNALKFWNGTSAVTVATGLTAITSLNGLTSASQTFANGSTGTAPAFNSSGSTHTLNIPLAATGSVTAGLLSNADYTQIVRKDGTVAFTADQSLGVHKLTNVVDPSAAQDAATRNYSDLHLAGDSVDPSLSTLVGSGVGAGKLITWDAASNRWTAALPATNGTVTSVALTLPSIFSLTGSPITSTGTFAASLSSQSANMVFAGPLSGGTAAPTFRSLNLADLKSSGGGALFVAPNCTAAQTLSWSSASDSFSCQAIGSLPWSAIGSGKPTTLAGYGVTDAVANAGGAPSVQTGTDASKPATPLAGAIYFASDTKIIYQFNSGAWVSIATSNGSGGTITALTGDVSASGSNSVAATVNSVGGSTAANIHTAELIANAATSANIVSTIIARDSSGNFSAAAGKLKSVQLSDTQTTPNTATLQAPTTISTSYVLKLPTALPGTSGYVLSSDTSGNLSWLAPATGSVTSVAATAPLVSSGGTTPSLSIPVATASVDGYLAQADWSTFNNKLSKTLTSAQLFVGNASNVATGVALSGDATLTNAGALTVTKLQGYAVAATTPMTSGQVLRWNGSAWSPNFVAMTDLRSTITGSNAFASSCLASQTLTFNSATDSMSCSDISIAAGTQLTGTLAAGHGGTGQSTFATGDLLYASSASALSRLPASTDGKVLTLASGVPSWSTPAVSPWITLSSNIYFNTGNVGIGTSTPSAPLTVAGNVQVTGGGNLISTDSTQLILQETGDQYGTVSLAMQNRSGLNGALFTNSSIDLVDFGFKTSSGSQMNWRYEHRGSSMANSANTTGEMQLFENPLGGASVPFLVGKGAILFSTPGFGGQAASTANVGIGTLSPTAKLQVHGAIVADAISSSGQCVNFATGNMQVATYASSNTLKLGGLVDGGAYTVVLTGYTAGQTVTVSGYTDTGCTTAVTTGVDFGGSTSAVTPTFTAAGNTQILTFIYSATQGSVYASASTNFFH